MSAYMMHQVAFDVDSAERPCGTEIFALAATDTAFVVDGRYMYLTPILGRVINQPNSTCRTMPRTSRTDITLAHRNTIGLDPNGVTDMNSCLLFFGHRFDGTGRAHLRAMRALGSAVTPFEREHRLHQVHRVGRRTQHMVRTGADT